MDEHRPDPAEESVPDNPASSTDESAGTEKRRVPLGGDETTEQQLGADNEVEKDMLDTLDPEDPPA